MSKRITIWSPKGGQGKTSLALAIALEYEFLVFTNDTHSPIADILPEGESYALAPDEEFPELTGDFNLIYDLGGKSEERVVTAIKDSQVVIMPVIFNSPLEMQVFLEGVEEVSKITKNIILVVNGCKPRAFKNTKEIIQTALEDIGTFPIFEIKDTSAFRNVVENGMSIKELCESNALHNYHFKLVYKQMRQLMTEVFDRTS